MCMNVSAYLQMPRETKGMRCTEAGVVGSYVMPGMGAGKQTNSAPRQEHLTITPYLCRLTLFLLRQFYVGSPDCKV